jgi:hypothetical protein
VPLQVIVVNRITDPQLQQAEGEAVAAVAQAAQYGDVQKVQVGMRGRAAALLAVAGSSAQASPAFTASAAVCEQYTAWMLLLN